jgi:chemotaxis family two-component system sensor kinase Cph1
MQMAQKHDTHNHVLFMYGSRDERLQVLAEYFNDGVNKGELCIFATPDTPEQVVMDFLPFGFDAGKAIDQRDLRVFEMTSTYLPHGQFVADFMLSNVAQFITDAKAGGYKGLRTAGEMAWLYEHPEFLAGAGKYEADITGLAGENPQFTGLCLYPLREGSRRILDTAMQTHPSFMYDGTVQPNPFNKRHVPG